MERVAWGKYNKTIRYPPILSFMLSHLLKGLATAVLFWLVNRYRQTTIDLLKLEAAALYLKGVQGARQGVLAALLLWLAIFIFALGVVMLHFALFMGLYLFAGSLTVVACALAGLGAVYVIVVALVVRRLLSESSWIKIFKADRLVAELAGK